MTPPPPAGRRAPGDHQANTGTLANDAVDLTVRRGEIHALMGENGAGKWTAMSVMFGMERTGRGRGAGRRPARSRFRSPADAIASGLGMVHQRFQLFDR